MEEVLWYLGTMYESLWLGASVTDRSEGQYSEENVQNVLQGSRIYGQTDRQVGLAEL